VRPNIENRAERDRFITRTKWRATSHRCSTRSALALSAVRYMRSVALPVTPVVRLGAGALSSFPLPTTP
jgi:hypothetical protein